MGSEGWEGVGGGEESIWRFGYPPPLLLNLLLCFLLGMVIDMQIEYQGMRRIREILETHDWAPSSLSDDDEDKDDPEADDIEKMLLGAEDDTGFGLEVDELEREMVGLRFAIERGGGSGREDSQDEGDDELRVDAVEALMLRMAAIRGMYS